jgi:hypothetical protein
VVKSGYGAVYCIVFVLYSVWSKELEDGGGGPEMEGFINNSVWMLRSGKPQEGIITQDGTQDSGVNGKRRRGFGVGSVGGRNEPPRKNILRKVRREGGRRDAQ